MRSFFCLCGIFCTTRSRFIFSYDLILAKRKSIQIRILPDKKIEVRAPYYLPKAKIDDFVRQKEKWILSKLNRPLSQIPVKHIFAPGESFYYRGKKFFLKSDESPASKNSVRFCEDEIFVRTKIKSPESFQNAFLKWQKEEAVRIFSGLFEDCWGIFSASFPYHKKPTLAVRAMKSRWGSLSRGRFFKPARMTLNIFLICADDDCIKQVIFHELCHLIQMNHSRDFYKCLEIFVPDWKILKERLENFFVELE